MFGCAASAANRAFLARASRSSSSSRTRTPRSAASSSCCAKIASGQVGVPDVALNIDAARRHARALHATHERFRAFDDEAEGGLPGMLGFERRGQLIERCRVCRSDRSRVRQSGARRQLRTTCQQ